MLKGKRNLKLASLALGLFGGLSFMGGCDLFRESPPQEPNYDEYYTQPTKYYQTQKDEEIYQKLFDPYFNYYTFAMEGYKANIFHPIRVFVSNDLTSQEKAGWKAAVRKLNEFFKQIYPDYSLSTTFVDDTSKYENSDDAIILKAQEKVDPNASSSAALMGTYRHNPVPYIVIYRDNMAKLLENRDDKTATYVEVFTHELMHAYGWDHTRNASDVLYSCTSVGENKFFSDNEIKFFISFLSNSKTDYYEAYKTYRKLTGGEQGVDEILEQAAKNIPNNATYRNLIDFEPNQILALKTNFVEDEYTHNFEDRTIVLNENSVGTYTMTQGTWSYTALFEIMEVDKEKYPTFPVDKVILLHDYKSKTFAPYSKDIVWSQPETLVLYPCNKKVSSSNFEKEGFYEWRLGGTYCDDITDEYMASKENTVKNQARQELNSQIDRLIEEYQKIY